MDRWCGKVAVVTGASSGIGAAICEKLVQHGLKVVGLARRDDKVSELASKLKGQRGELHAVKCDVTNAVEVDSAFSWIESNVGLANILINNAGLFKLGTIIDGEFDDWKETLDTNVLAVCACTRRAVGHMRRSGCDGHVVLMNSVAGRLVVTGSPPHNNLYSPSKHALTCVNEVLRREIAHAGDRIKVTSICPGYVDTDIFATAGRDKQNLRQMDPTLPTFLKSGDVADSVVYTLATPSNVQIYELTIIGTTYE